MNKLYCNQVRFEASRVTLTDLSEYTRKALYRISALRAHSCAQSRSCRSGDPKCIPDRFGFGESEPHVLSLNLHVS